MRFALKCIESILDRYVHAVAKDGRAALAAYNALFDELERGEAEKDDLRAYKERTEAALTEFSSELSNYGGVPTNYYREELRRLGLWREGSA